MLRNYRGVAVAGRGDAVDGVGDAVDGVGDAVDGAGDAVDGAGDAVDGVGEAVEGVGIDVGLLIESGFAEVEFGVLVTVAPTGEPLESVTAPPGVGRAPVSPGFGAVLLCVPLPAV
jgi:X-X-X-Leu-X-X-Gly heptad repeat protein